MSKDKTFVIFGATAGLATTFLEDLARQKASLLLHCRDEKKGQRLQETLNALGASSISLLISDALDPDLPQQLREKLDEMPTPSFGFISFLGIPTRIPPQEWTPQNFAEAFSLNSAAPLLLCKRWAEYMKSRNLTGNAVLISTMQAMYPFEGSLIYSMSKGALQLGVEILAKELGDEPAIKVNAIAPGVIEAGMALASIQRGKYAPYVADGRIQRYGQPEDIAKTLHFLLDPELYMTGQTLLLDGGLTLRRDLRR